MGLVYAEIVLTNAEDIGLLLRRGFIKEDQVRKIKVNSIVDSEVYMMVIPEHIKIQLGVEQVEQREVELADGKIHLSEVVGPIEIRFANRRAISNAFVMGNEVLLGAIPMAESDTNSQSGKPNHAKDENKITKKEMSTNCPNGRGL